MLPVCGRAELVHEIRAATLEDIEGEADVITNNRHRLDMAIALALLGESEQAWPETRALLDQPRGVTARELKLNPQFRVWYHGIPEYQRLVEAL